VPCSYKLHIKSTISVKDDDFGMLEDISSLWRCLVDVAFKVKEEVARKESKMIYLVFSGDNRLQSLASSFITS
jgi:hypothetical protein